MYWLIRYQQTVNGRTISTNTVIDKHPADWFLDLLTEYPNNKNEVLFALEISKKQYESLENKVG